MCLRKRKSTQARSALKNSMANHQIRTRSSVRNCSTTLNLGRLIQSMKSWKMILQMTQLGWRCRNYSDRSAAIIKNEFCINRNQSVSQLPQTGQGTQSVLIYNNRHTLSSVGLAATHSLMLLTCPPADHPCASKVISCRCHPCIVLFDCGHRRLPSATELDLASPRCR